jgi:hypothetical protein
MNQVNTMVAFTEATNKCNSYGEDTQINPGQQYRDQRQNKQGGSVRVRAMNSLKHEVYLGPCLNF